MHTAVNHRHTNNKQANECCYLHTTNVNVNTENEKPRFEAV